MCIKWQFTTWRKRFGSQKNSHIAEGNVDSPGDAFEPYGETFRMS